MSPEERGATVTGGRPAEIPPSWFWALAAGWVPAMGVGFTFSALADRLVFVGWGLGAALVYSWALRQGIEAGHPTPSGLLAGAAALLVLGLLLGRHHESLDLGYRAFLPGLYHPWIIRPGISFGLGIACGLGAALSSKQPWMQTLKRRTSR